MDKPVAVIVPRVEELENVKQYYVTVENEELKLGKLYALFLITGVERLVIFVNTKNKAVSLAKDVGKHYTVSASHDSMDQRARDTAIQKLKSGSSSILITTDHRGTNNAILQVPIIINYDLPTESMRYIRRLQQQNRQFRRPVSVVINLATPADRRTLSAITGFCNRSIGELHSDLK
jgi:translation initiation factor 4A